MNEMVRGGIKMGLRSTRHIISFDLLPPAAGAAAATACRTARCWYSHSIHARQLGSAASVVWLPTTIRPLLGRVMATLSRRSSARKPTRPALLLQVRQGVGGVLSTQGVGAAQAEVHSAYAIVGRSALPTAAARPLPLTSAQPRR